MSGTALAGSSGLLSSWSFQGGTHLLPFKRGIYFPATPGCHLHVHPSAPGSWFHLQRRQRVITFKPLSTSGPPASLLMGPVITLDWPGKPTIPSPSQSLFLHHICMPFATWGDVYRPWGMRMCTFLGTAVLSTIPFEALFFLEVGFTWVCFCSVLPWAPWMMMLCVWQMPSLPTQLCMHFCTTWTQPTLS